MRSTPAARFWVTGARTAAPSVPCGDCAVTDVEHCIATWQSFTIRLWNAAREGLPTTTGRALVAQSGQRMTRPLYKTGKVMCTWKLYMFVCPAEPTGYAGLE